MEMVCLSKQDSPKCLRSHGAEKDAAEGSQARSPWEELPPGGCLERSGDRPQESVGLQKAEKEGSSSSAACWMEALPTARSLTAGERLLAMGAPPIKPLRSPPRKETQHLDSVPPRGQRYTTIIPGKQEPLCHLPHLPSPPCSPGRGLVGGEWGAGWGNGATGHALFPPSTPPRQTSARPPVQRRLINWMRFCTGLDFSLECHQQTFYCYKNEPSQDYTQDQGRTSQETSLKRKMWKIIKGISCLYSVKLVW